MTLVVAAGIPRSGSTWLFNAARIILGLDGQAVNSHWIEKFDETSDASTHLVKIHEPSQQWASKANVVLCSHRDLRDIVVSLRDMGWTDWDKMLGAARSVREMHEFWSPRAHLDLAYQTLTAEPYETLRRIGAALGVSLSDAQCVDILAAIPTSAAAVGPLGWDQTSLLHPKHITNGRPGRWIDDLPQSIADEIWLRHSDWLQAHGYTRVGTP